MGWIINAATNREAQLAFAHSMVFIFLFLSVLQDRKLSAHAVSAGVTQSPPKRVASGEEIFPRPSEQRHVNGTLIWCEQSMKILDET
jgi:hypothetical protein